MPPKTAQTSGADIKKGKKDDSKLSGDVSKPFLPELVEEKEEEQKPVVKTGFGKEIVTRKVRVPEWDHL
jgi:hypothetical protein